MRRSYVEDLKIWISVELMWKDDHKPEVTQPAIDQHPIQWRVWQLHFKGLHLESRSESCQSRLGSQVRSLGSEPGSLLGQTQIPGEISRIPQWHLAKNLVKLQRCAPSRFYAMGHFHDDDVRLQLPEFISPLLSYLTLSIPPRFKEQ